MTEKIRKDSRRSPTGPGEVGRQFAALPLLRDGGTLAVVLVTSRDTGRWVLPKGWSEPDLDGAETAAKEAFEEAGLIGAMEAQPRGVYRYLKRLTVARHLTCEVEVFAMEVVEMLPDWPEKAERRRGIFPPAEAAALVAEAELAALLRTLR